MDPNSADKVKFHIGDVGASTWEEISVGGADYAKANYGWPPMEGPCDRGSNKECPIRNEYEDPIYYYEHTKDEEGGAVTGSVFVPDGIWPSAYKFLYIDFIHGGVYNLIRDTSLECRDCVPPVPGYRNETFHKHKDMVDLFFGPYKDSQALYIVSRSEGQNIRRIIYTGTNNRSPIAKIEVESSLADVGERVFFDGRTSSDPDGDGLTFNWDFGDGETSTDIKPVHRYKKKGQYTVTLIVTDDNDQSAETFVVVQIGSPPTGTILSPAENEKFYVGQIIHLLGSGKDSLGKQLNSSQLVWEVQQHHASHFHPFLDKTTGNDFDLFAAPEPEDFKAATISFLKIILYVTDDDGLTTEVVRIVDPILVLVDVDSKPRNLSILVDEFRVMTPTTITTWENHNLRLDVEDQYPFLFDSWSDGGERSHKMQIPKASLATNPHISATFQEDSLSYKLIDLVSTIKNCSSTEMCGRCEGHCQSDAECMGTLICYKKTARNESVPGCLGLDASNTDWCALSSFSTFPPTEVSTPSPTFGLWNPSSSLSFGVSDAATPSPTTRATYAAPVAIPDPSDTQSPITFAPVSSSNFVSASMTLTPIMSSIQLIESPGLKSVQSDGVSKQWIFTIIITLSTVIYNSLK
jgi:PKD repeat protein